MHHMDFFGKHSQTTVLLFFISIILDRLFQQPEFICFHRK